MIDFLSSISDAAVSLIRYFCNNILNIVHLLALLPQALNFLYASIAFLPPSILLFAYIGILLTVCYFIIGR